MLDKNTILVSLIYAALTGIFNLALGRKSQVEAWATSNPKLAALLKFTRALGLDPWNLASSALLLFKGRLPEAQQANSPIAKVEQRKADIKTLDAVDTARIVPPLLVLLLAGLALHQSACNPAKPPCDENKLRAIDAAYLEEVGKQCLSYASAAQCPSLPGLRAKHSAALHEACN